MKILKRLAIAVLILVGLLLVLGLFAPKELVLKKSITINVPQAAAFEAVNELTAWENWSPWLELDPTIKNVYTDPTSGKGAYVTWTSEKSGNGKMTITDVYNMDSLMTNLDFEDQGTATAKFVFTPKDKNTEVSWDFYSEMSYPMNIMPWLFGAESMLSDSYEKGLANLKAYVEENYETSAAYDVKKIDFPATHYLVKRTIVSFDDIEAHFQTTMPAVATAFVQNNVEMAGPASAVFYVWDQEKKETDVAIGIEADASAVIDGLTGIDVAAGQALQIDYYGPYEGTGAAHEAMEAYMKANGIESAPTAVIERYLTDPSEEHDPAKWLTEVIYVLGE